MVRVPEERQGKPRACEFLPFPSGIAVAPASRRGRLDQVARQGRRRKRAKRAGGEEQAQQRLRSAEELSKPGAAMRALRGIRRRITQLDTDYRRELYGEIMNVRDVVAVLRASFDAWTEFCRDPVWRKADARHRPKLNAPDEALRFAVFELCAKVKKGRKRNRRISVYLAALRELDARGVPIVETVPTMFDTKGVRGLSRAWAERQRAERAVAGLGEKPREGGHAHKSHPDDDDLGKSSSDKTIKVPAKRKRAGGLGELKQTSGTPKPDLIAAFLKPSKALRRLLKGGAGSEGNFIVTVAEELRGEPVLRLKKLE